jgi:hypothetical protein
VTFVDKARADALRVEFFDAWDRALDDALAVLREMPTCPHELYRAICRNPSLPPKKLALVSENGAPVAVASLRRRQRHWEPALYGVTHDAVMPAKEGYLYAALAALKLDIWVIAAEELPLQRWIRSYFGSPRYAMAADADFEEYWGRSDLGRLVRAARKRTADFRFEVDGEGGAAWTVERWAERWASDAAEETIVKSDLLLSADFLQKRDLYHSFRLMDGERPVAGHNFLVLGDSILSQTTHFDDEYRGLSVGSRLTDLIFYWARESGYRKIDLGGGHTYKLKWAPQDGELWNYNICPEHLHRVKQASKLVSTAVHQAGVLGRGLAGRIGAGSR